MSNDDKQKQNSVNHIMAGEIRFNVDFPTEEVPEDMEDIEIMFNWNTKFGPFEQPPHIGQPPEK